MATGLEAKKSGAVDVIDNDALRLASLLCSRLTHDLAGPAGAIANGLELGSALSGGEVDALMGAASAQLKSRLAFLRRAYGTGQSLTWDEARQISDAYLLGGRHSLTWTPQETGDVRRAQLVLNMILCAVEFTPSGGAIHVEQTEFPSVAAQGELKQLELPAAETFFQDLTPRQVQPVFTAHLAASLGLDLDADVVGPTHLIWRVQPIK